MPIISTKYQINIRLVLTIRLISGLVWFGTVIRRLGSNYGNFEERIATMSEGTTIFPELFMNLAVDNWFIIYLIVITLEILSSISLLTGTLARAGALFSTLNGFGIGMAGLGLGLIDLIIPWSVALLTLVLFLFTHPGRFKGVDSILHEKNLPRILQIWT
ncbi:MAG: hypothetical protein IH840_06725 [Candidatus Heimdallarchaeota archaeon]|nr:hypothetical protein [Candidatus Heimdallarchaeota archaeon]